MSSIRRNIMFHQKHNDNDDQSVRKFGEKVRQISKNVKLIYLTSQITCERATFRHQRPKPAPLPKNFRHQGEKYLPQQGP